jgi:hypothetical protein
VKKLGWSVDVRQHVIKEVVMNVLEGDAWWGEDDENSGVDEAGSRSLFGWNKRGKKGKKGEDEEERKKRREGKRNVPKAMIEDDCVVSLHWRGEHNRHSLIFHPLHRIASSGSLGTSRTS